MRTNLLIDSIVRQTTILIAQLSSAAGLRAPLAHLADEVFLSLSRELEQQGVVVEAAEDVSAVDAEQIDEEGWEPFQGASTMEELGEVAKEACLCALGTSAPNPFLSTVRYFRDEYEAHIKENRCPSLSCKELTAYYIDPAKCQACMICARKCPVEAIDGGKKKIHVIDQDKCTKCGTCIEVCPPRFDAVKKCSGVPIPSSIPEEERNIIRKSNEK